MQSVGSARLGPIGLGSVGLSLAFGFGKTLDTLGFEISQSHIDGLRMGEDSLSESSTEALGSRIKLRMRTDAEDLRGCNAFIATVPTPSESAKRPSLRPLHAASEIVGRALKSGDIGI